MSARVSYLGKGSRSLVASKTDKVIFYDSAPKEVSDAIARMAKQANTSEGREVFTIVELGEPVVEAPRPEIRFRSETPEPMIRGKQPDITDRLGPKRTVQDVIADCRRIG